jgi:RNA polymerase sigma factor (sigma-70 family)
MLEPADEPFGPARRPRPARVRRSLHGAHLDALNDLVRGLPEERREAVVLTQVTGLSYAEAAEICGCPAGTIRSRVARAREDLLVAYRDTDRRRTG